MSVDKFLKSIVKESVSNALKTRLLSEAYGDLQKEADDEKDRQEKAKSDVESLFADEEIGGDDEEEKMDKSPTEKASDDKESDVDLGVGKEPKEEKPKEERPDTSQAAQQKAKAVEDVAATTEGVIELVNLIRSGRSTEDPKIMSQLKAWFEGMKTAEQLMTMIVLEGLKDIITAGESAQEADKPSDPDSNVKVTRKDDVARDEHGQPRDWKQQPKVVEPSSSPRNVTSQPRLQQKRSGGLEDITPPIVVGPRNEAYVREYKNKIKELFDG